MIDTCPLNSRSSCRQTQVRSVNERRCAVADNRDNEIFIITAGKEMGHWSSRSRYKVQSVDAKSTLYCNFTVSVESLIMAALAINHGC